MASRLHRPRRLARRGCAAFAIAACLLAGAARAQEEAADDLGLKGVEAQPSAVSTAGAAADPPAKPKLDPKARKVALPPLAPYRGAQRLGLRGGSKPLSGGAPAPTVAALPAPTPTRKPRDDRPFDPVGVRLGDLRLTPFVEEDLGWSSNPGLLPGSQKGSPFLTSEMGFGLNSDWSNNAIHGDFKGGLTDYFADHSADAPFASGLLDGRFDASRDLRFDAEGRFVLTTMTAGALGLRPNVAFGPSGAPLTATYGATAGGDALFGRLDLALHGSLDRTAYENATLSDGAVEDLSSDDFNDWGFRARATYDVSPELRPFVDALIDTRRYDLGEDESGYQRNSDGVALRAGADIELTHVLTGSLDVGYGERNYQDPRLPQLASPLFDASLVWTATPLTTVTLKSVSSLADTTIRGASGAAQHASTLEIDHALRRYLTLSGTVSYLTDAYVGVPLRDATTTFGLAASYSLNRDVVVKASISRQLYWSNQAGTSYAATVVTMGLKLQR